MSDPNDKIEVIQAWINDLSAQRDSGAVELSAADPILTEMLDTIQRRDRMSSEQGLSETYNDLEKQVEVQSASLTLATNALKNQISERETAAIKLRKAYNDLETHLQDHIADHSRLNQRLQEQINEYKRVQTLEQEERALTEALRDTLATMSNTLDLDKILDHILDTIKRVTPYDGANVLLVESDLVRVVRQRGYIEKGAEKEFDKQQIPTTKLATLQQLIQLGKPLAIPDTATSPLWLGFPYVDWVSSNVIAPIRFKGKLLGFISLDSATPSFFTQIHAERLQTFADQAAIVIQNARLLARAKHAAVMAERNRLASELHDTISQTLWSMSLITERLPVIWEIDQEEGRRSLSMLHQLSQNSLIEMKSLLMELHPASLTDAKLGNLIRQAAEIIANRTGLDIMVRIEGQAPVPPEVHFALYRVAQEALNNVALHASAAHVEVYYKSEAGHVHLAIQDNGLGFDPSTVDLGHLGLIIMADRIKNIGGTLETISQEGQGTLIKVIWTLPDDE